MAKYGKNNKYHERYRPVHGSLVVEHPLYATWGNMKDRCYNVDARAYADYGGRGILMCDEWYKSFEAFALDMGMPPTPKHMLDRRDNDQGYSKENCRWATRNEQMRNRRKFKTNTSGATGVVPLKNGRFAARYDDNGIRYHLGHFESVSAATEYRNTFALLLSSDRDAAMAMTERRVRFDSTTGVKGITKNKDGFLVRKTIDGVRTYLGFSTTFEGAMEIWNAHK